MQQLRILPKRKGGCLQLQFQLKSHSLKSKKSSAIIFGKMWASKIKGGPKIMQVKIGGCEGAKPPSEVERSKTVVEN